MTAPLGVRWCMTLGCNRKTHVTETGIHYSRCLSHTLGLLTGVFATPSRTTDGVPPVPSVVLPAAAPAIRP